MITRKIPYARCDSSGRIIERVMLAQNTLASLASWIYLQGFAPLADEPRGDDCVPYVQYGAPGRVTQLFWAPARFADQLQELGFTEAAAA